MQKKKIKEVLSKFRLMVSGSMALPDTLFHKWREVSSHKLLERYGMTEFGMAISNPYDTEKRVAGTVGQPLPGVSIRIVPTDDHNENEVAETTSNTEIKGELQVKGDNVFKEYWNNQEATKKEFTNDGWFKTGDIAQCIYPVFENSDKSDFKYVKILGRNSVDILKSGGYKISALEIERCLLENEKVKEVAVL